MLRTFIFDDSKSQWREEEHTLLSQDMCVILDEDQEVVYFWRGSKSTRKIYKKGYIQLKELITDFPELNLQLILAEKNFPDVVQKKLETMLESAKNEGGSTVIFSRFITIRTFFISVLGVIIVPIIYLLNLSTALLWSTSSTNLGVQNTAFKSWINTSKIFIIFTIVFLVINLIIGIIEVENQAIIFSIVGLIICVGLFFYLNFDIFLFTFQSGSTLTTFLILRSDLLFFISINLFSVIIFEIPNIYKFISFLKIYRKFIF
ncbi:MAG: hypothetical protein ACW972_02805 [Promethearchaeota archaeon]|jgi:hypothetical protein